METGQNKKTNCCNCSTAMCHRQPANKSTTRHREQRATREGTALLYLTLSSSTHVSATTVMPALGAVISSALAAPSTPQARTTKVVRAIVSSRYNAGAAWVVFLWRE